MEKGREREKETESARVSERQSTRGGYPGSLNRKKLFFACRDPLQICAQV